MAYPSNKVSRGDYQSKLSHILDNFHVSRIVIDEHDNDMFKKTSQAFVVEDYEQQSSRNLQEIKVTNLNPSFIQFSSGSTGIPKAMQFNFGSTYKHTFIFKTVSR